MTKSLPRHPHREYCGLCGDIIRVGLIVPDDIWERVVHHSRLHDIHCIQCFTRRADEQQIEWDADIRFYATSWVSHERGVRIGDWPKSRLWNADPITDLVRALEYMIEVREIKCEHKHPPPDEFCALCKANAALDKHRYDARHLRWRRRANRRPLADSHSGVALLDGAHPGGQGSVQGSKGFR